MVNFIWTGLFLPLLGFLILLTSSSTISRRLAGLIGCSTILMSFLCFSGFLLNYSFGDQPDIHATLYRWIPIDGINADFTLLIDSLSLLMTLIITGVGFLIHVYSIGYMDHDEDYARFFACMNFFVFAMLLLVLAGNLLLLFVGWEGVGLASYLLIGFWYNRPSAAQAATKAFIVNRIGDLGLLIGLLLTFHLFGTSDINTVSLQAGKMFAYGAPIITLLTLLYFFGATGKSAQIPLQTWLPDAMEGPTPVSALIHAATMVTAGVYLIVRMHPVFMHAPVTLCTIGTIGGATSLYASLCGLGQTDLKRVLAFSTVSQLGLMFLACGIGAFYSAMFHLTTHAFVKALLFLSAGNVVHMLHGTTEMGKMGGLAKIFTKTHWLFLIGLLAMSGIPPLAAFFSKDMILEVEYMAGYEELFYVALTASILTGVYLTRAYCLTFRGTSHLDEHERNTAKEAPKVMLIPVTILAILSIGGGFLGFTFGKTPILEKFLAEVGVTLAEKELSSHLIISAESLMAIFGALLGVSITAIIYTKYYDHLGNTLQFLKKAFYIDNIYQALLVQPLASVSRFIDNVLEPKLFDGSIRYSTQATNGIAAMLQRFQSGQLRSYVAWMVVGTVLLIAYMVF